MISIARPVFAAKSASAASSTRLGCSAQTAGLRRVDFSGSAGGLGADRVGVVSVFGAGYAEVDNGAESGQLILQGHPHRTPEGFELTRPLGQPVDGPPVTERHRLPPPAPQPPLGSGLRGRPSGRPAGRRRCRGWEPATKHDGRRLGKDRHVLARPHPRSSRHVPTASGPAPLEPAYGSRRRAGSLHQSLI